MTAGGAPGDGGAQPRLLLDPGAAEPPFEQLRAQVAAQVGDGSLPAGTRMPTVRALADRLGVAPGTVARAYRELEAAGLLDTRGRAGTFVRGPDREAQARAAAREYAVRVTALGVEPAQALELVVHALGLEG